LHNARLNLEYEQPDIKPIEKESNFWSKKQKRSYNTIKTGLVIARRERKNIRFLTLNTSDVQRDKEDYDDSKLNDNHRKLKQRIQRMTPLKMVQYGYIKSSDLRHYYPGISLNQNLTYDYFKVQTNEGNGVLHIVYKGDYLPYNYLVDEWQDIHNSWNVNIKRINNNKRDIGKVSSYVVSQYLANQESSYVRSSQTWKWLFRGYRKAFKQFLSMNLKDWKHQYKDPITGNWTAPYKENVDFKRLIERWNNEVYRIIHPIKQQYLPVPI